MYLKKNLKPLDEIKKSPLTTKMTTLILRLILRDCWDQGSTFGSGRPEPDRAQANFQAAGVGLGLEITGLTGLGLEVYGLKLIKYMS